MSSTNNGGGDHVATERRHTTKGPPKLSDTKMASHEMRRYSTFGYSSASHEETKTRYNRNTTKQTEMNNSHSSDDDMLINTNIPLRQPTFTGRLTGLRTSRVSGALTNSFTKALSLSKARKLFLRRSTEGSRSSMGSIDISINNNDSNDLDNSNTDRWDLDYCISIIETLQTSTIINNSDDNNVVTLTPLQMDAIKHLRSAQAASASKDRPIRTGVGSKRMSEMKGSGGRSRASMSRRNAHFFGQGDNQPALLTHELFQCFQEVEEGSKDEQNNVTAVLANYGGEAFESFSNIAPHRERRKSFIETTSLHLPGVDSNNNDESPRSMIRRAKSAFLPGFSNKGVNDFDEFVDLDVSELDRSASNSLLGTPMVTQRRDAKPSFDPLTASKHNISQSLLNSSSMTSLYSYGEKMKHSVIYCPPEWNALTKDARKELTNLLSWENLGKWEFNVLDVSAASSRKLSKTSLCDEEVGETCPLLLVGWAILCAPMAQNAMEGSLGDERNNGIGSASEKKEKEDRSRSLPCYFDLDITPEKVCNFLREIEKRYNHNIPYHNNIHAADVTQTLHCLLQFVGEEQTSKIWDPVEIFAIILAATFHDVGHDGMNNLYQKHTRSNLAIRYNDISILENMHSAVGHSLLMGDDKEDEWDIFADWDSRQIDKARTVMMDAVLGTDMSNHFESVGKITAMMEKIQLDALEAGRASKRVTIRFPDRRRDANGGEVDEAILSILVHELGSANNIEMNEDLKKECKEFARFLLKLLLHAADISNPTKKNELAVHWAEKALSEFFHQGDNEELLGIPISPLCDRRTVKKADSQVGFLKFVIRPTFMLLGGIIPRVKDEVIPIIEENINFWISEKSKGMWNVVRNVSRTVSSQASSEKSAT